MRSESHSDGLVQLAYFENQMESEMVQNVLRAEGIAVQVHDRVSIGGYMKIISGISVFGESLLVRREDYEHAREILSTLQFDWEHAIDYAQPNAMEDVEAFEEQENSRLLQHSPANNNASTVLIPVFLTIGVILMMLALRFQGKIPTL